LIARKTLHSNFCFPYFIDQQHCKKKKTKKKLVIAADRSPTITQKLATVADRSPTVLSDRRPLQVSVVLLIPKIVSFRPVGATDRNRHDCGDQHRYYKNMSVVPTVRRPSPTVGVRTAIGKYSRRSVGDCCKFL
jgi:hypothetical protein